MEHLSLTTRIAFTGSRRLKGKERRQTHRFRRLQRRCRQLQRRFRLFQLFARTHLQTFLPRVLERLVASIAALALPGAALLTA